jgi:hypothetical protein
MAKQLGILTITGCHDNLLFYAMEGIPYVRKKSSLSGKRVKKSKAFQLTMVYAGIMAQASKIASSVYRQIPKEKREVAFFRTLTGIAQKLIRKGISEEDVYEQLHIKAFPPSEPIVIITPKVSAGNTNAPNKVMNKLLSQEVEASQNFVTENFSLHSNQIRER